jgi:hypothetical protein
VGTGTITGVTAGADLTGGGTSGNVTLNLNTTALNSNYAQLGAANTFTEKQTVNGTLSVRAAPSAATPAAAISDAIASTSGILSGVSGETNASAGFGVYGANLGTGPATGVYGVSTSLRRSVPQTEAFAPAA